MKVDFTFEKQGDIVYCKGFNFEYQKIGDTSLFKQYGKVPSLRIIKTIIKELEKGE